MDFYLFKTSKSIGNSLEGPIMVKSLLFDVQTRKFDVGTRKFDVGTWKFVVKKKMWGHF